MVTYFEEAYERSDIVTVLSVWDDYLFSASSSGIIKKWGKGGECIMIFRDHYNVQHLAVLNNILYSFSQHCTKRWNQEGLCIETVESSFGHLPSKVVRYNNFLYVGYRSGLIKRYDDAIILSGRHNGQVSSFIEWNNILYSCGGNNIKKWLSDDCIKTFGNGEEITCLAV